MTIRLIRDYYEILGIARNATAEKTKKAYRGLAFKYHPDCNKEYGAEEKIKELNKAYEVLGNPKKKAAYDKQRAYYAQAQFTAKPYRPAPYATEELIQIIVEKGAPWWAKVAAGACLFADIYFKTKESYRGAK